MLGDAATYRVLLNSILIALPRTVLALVLATAFAWCIARTDYAGPALARRTPGVYVLLAGAAVGPGLDAPGAPNVGLLNQWLGAMSPA